VGNGIQDARERNAPHTDTRQHPKPVGDENADNNAAAEEKTGTMQARQRENRLHAGKKVVPQVPKKSPTATNHGGAFLN
jgi:hypothetical protein